MSKWNNSLRAFENALLSDNDGANLEIQWQNILVEAKKDSEKKLELIHAIQHTAISRLLDDMKMSLVKDYLDDLEVPKEGWGLFLQAQNMYYGGEDQKAEELYQELRRSFPGYPIPPHQAGNKGKQKKHGQNQENRSVSIPWDAYQAYSRAKSYIAGGDLYLAQKSLEMAIALAHNTNVEYKEAQNDLDKVIHQQTIETKREEALELILRKDEDDSNKKYYQALETLRKIKDDSKIDNMALALEKLLNLDNAWEDKTLDEQKNELDQIKNIGEIAATPLYKKLRTQQEKARREAGTRQFVIRVGVLATVAVVIGLFVFFVYLNWDSWRVGLFPPPTNTPSLTLTFTPSFTAAETSTPTSAVTVTTTSTPPATSTATSTRQVLGIVMADYSAFRSPTGLQEDYIGTLRGGQSVRILRKQSGSQTWYLCEWFNNGLISQGWIQATRVQLLNEPGISEPDWLDITPVPTLSQTPTP